MMDNYWGKPAFTLQSWPVEVAVMEDGTLLDY